MSGSPTRCPMHSTGNVRSARQGLDGRRRAHGAGAAPKSPRGAAPPTASAAAILSLRSRFAHNGHAPLAWIVAATALATLSATHPAAAQSVEDRARAAAAAARARSGDSDALKRNYVTPGLAGQPITTVDSKRSFVPRLACQKTATLMEVLVQPSAKGDLGQVQIARDTDLDGTIDSRSSLGVPVSGICANGVISCDPGTWSSCGYFRWDVDADLKLKLAEVEMAELAGCYCINNSCGTNLAWSNLGSVLGDLGGGMIGALTTADPRIGVAEAVIDGPVIRYVGAQTTSCTASAALPQIAYRANPTTIASDAQRASATSSVFQAVAASPAGAGKAEQTRKCTIEREVSARSWAYDDIVTAFGPFEFVESCGPDCRRYRMYGEGSCAATPPAYTASFRVAKPDRIRSVRITRIAGDDWVQARVNGAVVGYAGKRPWLGDGLPSGDCSVDEDPVNNSAIDVTPAFGAGDASVTMRVRGGDGRKWGTLDLEVRVDTSCEFSERLVDLCSGLATDPACRLGDERVDGVATFRNGVQTGLRPLPQSRQFGTAECQLTLQRDFFLRERSYRCAVDLGTLPKPDLSRGAYILDRSTETMLADRVGVPGGGHAESTRPFHLPDRGSVAACEPICKTRAPRVNSAAAPQGVVGSQQNDPASFDSFYHSCGTDNVCPLGPGEQIVSACGCLDDFPEAVVMMQTVRLAGADLVCTAAPQ